MIVEKRSIEYDANLVNTIGYSSDVSNLCINGIKFGNEKGQSVVELSKDGQLLTIYTEDKYVSVAKIFIDDIDTMSFKKCEEEYSIY